MTAPTRCCVLIVDDEPIINELVVDILQSANMDTLTAESGDEALNLLSKHAVDVVLSDIRMDGMSGFELLERTAEIDSSVKVILMTAFDSHDIVKKAMHAGAYDYLIKPFNDHELIVSLIQRAYESVFLQRENSRLIDHLQASNLKLSAANRRLMQLNKQLRKLAITDGLTQLHNRRFIDEWIQNYVMSNARYDLCYSIILLDVDHFKNVNDTHGHDAGDEVLRQLATILTDTARENDIVGRYGGEEFIVVLPGTGTNNASVCAERLREVIESAFVKIDAQSFRITVSIGIASYPGTLHSEDESFESDSTYKSGRTLITQADKALYTAKDLGRNLCVHFDELDTTDPVQQLAG